jgi:transcriptional regulator with PAS, ATPase and Fis domain
MNWFVLSLVLCILNIALWLWFFARFNARFSSDKILESLREAFNVMLREIQNEVSRDITLIDDRQADLRTLMDEAKRIILLSGEEIRKREREQVVIETIQNAQEVISGSPASQAVQAYQRTQGTQQTVEMPVVVKNPEPVTPKKSLKNQVLELYMAGVTPEETAKIFGISITEVLMYIELEGTGT